MRMSERLSKESLIAAFEMCANNEGYHVLIITTNVAKLSGELLNDPAFSNGIRKCYSTTFSKIMQLKNGSRITIMKPVECFRAHKCNILLVDYDVDDGLIKYVYRPMVAKYEN